MAKKRTKSKKNPSADYNPSSTKRPFHSENPDSYMTQKPNWAFSRCDREGEWPLFGLHHELWWSIVDKLKDFESMTWHDIMNDSKGGKYSKGSKSHFVETADLSKAAQTRLTQINIIEEKLFSLRLDGTHRLYGILTTGTLYFIWNDPKHAIYTVTKRRT